MSAHGELEKIFDKEKEQQRREAVQLISDISNEISDVMRTRSKLIATRDATDKISKVSA
ncbi:hypothetical protein [Kalamiella sp. sgz302252]|uniref:hypothetical protein n=1 Tax=Pantoea sp. sgz302252 TaxID=3341827 RepID=UPI0036D231DA